MKNKGSAAWEEAREVAHHAVALLSPRRNMNWLHDEAITVRLFQLCSEAYIEFSLNRPSQQPAAAGDDVALKKACATAKLFLYRTRGARAGDKEHEESRSLDDYPRMPLRAPGVFKREESVPCRSRPQMSAPVSRWGSKVSGNAVACLSRSQTMRVFPPGEVSHVALCVQTQPEKCVSHGARNMSLLLSAPVSWHHHVHHRRREG